MIKLAISRESGDEKSLPPLLISFPQGVPLFCDDLDLVLGERGKGKKRKLLVIGQSENALYRGSDCTDSKDSNGDNHAAAGLNGINNTNSCHYAIGIADEDSNELRLIPASHAFVMRPHLQGANAPQAPSRLSTMSNIDRRESLTEEFGSKKKKKAVQAKLSNTILSENISGARSIETVMSSLGGEFASTTDPSGGLVVDAAKDALEKQRREMLPFFNVNAKTPAEVFPMDKLIPENIFTSLGKYYDKILAATKTSTENLEDIDINMAESEGDLSASIANVVAEGGIKDNKSDDDTTIISGLIWVNILKKLKAGNLVLSLMTNLMSSLQKSMDEEGATSKKKDAKRKRKDESNVGVLSPQQIKEHKRNVCRILFLHFTIQYFTEVQAMPHHTVIKDNLIKAVGAPGDVTSYLSQRYGHYKVFKGTPQYSHSKTDIDRLLMYLLVLALSNSNYSINISLLANDLKLQPVKLGGLAKEVGCTIIKMFGSDRSNDSITTAELKVSLTFPERKKKVK